MVALDLHPPIARALLSAAAIAAALIVTVSHAAFGSTFKVGSIVIETPWSRATPGGAKVGVGYLTIKNDGATPDRLVSATTAIAGRTEIHLMSMDDGVMKMRPVADGVPVPANGSLVLGPNSYHLMFMDLARQLKQGEQFPSALVFEHAGTVDVTFDVEAIGAAAPQAAGHDHDSAHH